MKKKKEFSKACGWFITCLLSLLGIFLSGCSSFFYFPSTQSYYSPQRVNLKEEDVFFKSSANDSIHAWWFAATTKESKGTIVFFHGNAENITTHFLMLSWIPAEGYNYLIFDYPGYGISSGKPTQAGTAAAGLAAVEWVHENKDPRPLILYGHSLGGNIALRTAELVKDKVPLRNVIVEASFPSYQRMGRYVLKRSWITWWLQPLAWLTISEAEAPRDIASISPVPLLFIHGDADQGVELENSKTMLAAAKDPKELWIVPGGRHGDTYFREKGKYRQLLLDYLDKSASNKSTASLLK